jgi:hypothetical protein
MVYSANRFLSLTEMKVNAEHILGYLGSRGWTRNSICGMLGNMQSESTINPGIWQGLNSYDSTPYVTVSGQGYGLVQWTPFNKYTIWARDNGLTYSDMNAQLQRIEYEIANGLQWISTSSYPMSFQQFKVSTETPEYLAQAFIRNYERPADQNQPNRSTQARYWWDNLSGSGIIDPNEPTDPPPTGDEKTANGEALIHMLLANTISGWG